MCSNLEVKEAILGSPLSSIQDDVLGDDVPLVARAASPAKPNAAEDHDDCRTKKRKTRRGKPKRRKHYPYNKLNWKIMDLRRNHRQRCVYKKGCLMAIKEPALAPFNSNQFLMNDHGTKELEDKLSKYNESGSSVNPPRTRDSSFSVDSGEEMYSSPDDEEEFITKEFDTAYESMHAERLQSLSKADLIEEYTQLERKLELLTSHLRDRSTNMEDNEISNDENSSTANCVPVVEQFQQEIMKQQLDKLLSENDALKRENDKLRANVKTSSSSSSRDSESDSSDSCKSSSSSNNGGVETPVAMVEEQQLEVN